MAVLRQQMEEQEAQTLAPYAMLASASRGRVHPQSESTDRTCFQRDRDRIIHSKAFRRMEYKTQVFVNSEGDHYRTRLTHTMEVAQVCRSVARSLSLNVDLAEAVALSHDLGHPPFGHAGERALDELLADFGGFNHNVQTLRVVDNLESRYPDHPGLNLSYEVREGIARHESRGAVFDEKEFPSVLAPTLEAAIVDVADGVAYNSHDVDDGLASGLFSLDDLRATGLGERLLGDSSRQHADLSPQLRRYDVVRTLMGLQIRDLVAEIELRLKSENISTPESVRNARVRLVGFSVGLQTEIDELKIFLAEKLYSHPSVRVMSEEGQRTVRTVFAHFVQRPELMPEGFLARLPDESAQCVVRDYVAGMTDRFAESVLETADNNK